MSLIPQSTDPETLRIRAGDPAAIEAVVDANILGIYRAARASGLDISDAEDVVQATFVTFIETAARFEGRAHVRTWLFGILYRKIKESRRQRNREDSSDEGIEAEFEGRFHADGRWKRPVSACATELEERELAAQVQDCLGRVAPQQRMAFVLREIEELSTREVCKILGVSVTHLGVLLFRCRNNLRECLERKGITGSSSC